MTIIFRFIRAAFRSQEIGQEIEIIQIKDAVKDNHDAACCSRKSAIQKDDEKQVYE